MVKISFIFHLDTNGRPRSVTDPGVVRVADLSLADIKLTELPLPPPPQRRRTHAVTEHVGHVSDISTYEMDAADLGAKPATADAHFSSDDAALIANDAAFHGNDAAEEERDAVTEVEFFALTLDQNNHAKRRERRASSLKFKAGEGMCC